MKAAPSLLEETHCERLNIEIDGGAFVPSSEAVTLADILKEIQSEYSPKYIIISAEWNDSEVPEDIWNLNRELLIGRLSLTTRSRAEFFPEKLQTSLRHIEYLMEEFSGILHLGNEKENGQIAATHWQLVDDFQAFAEWILTIFDLDPGLKAHAHERLSENWRNLLTVTTKFSSISHEESGFIFKRETRRELIPLLESYKGVCVEALARCG